MSEKVPENLISLTVVLKVIVTGRCYLKTSYSKLFTTLFVLEKSTKFQKVKNSSCHCNKIVLLVVMYID